jgi:hypothetical protein
MRTIHSTVLAILVQAIIAGSTAANSPTVVYPTGNFPADVQNVQAALDKGGTVLLKATDRNKHPLAFNFGPAAPLPNNYVYFSKDVAIIGETIGSSKTTIRGGYDPFYGSFNHPVQASIEAIRFDGPMYDAILILGSKGLRIVGNEVVNVVPQTFTDLGFTYADGIDIFGSSNIDITGNVVIAGNVIGNLTGDFSIGIQLDTIGANVDISNNFFKIGQTVADNVGDAESAGIAAVRCHKPVLISGNVITIGPGTVYSGIVMVGDSDALFRVIGNFIDSQGPFTDGIDAFQDLSSANGGIDSAVINSNWIHLASSNPSAPVGGIILVGAVSRSTVQGNTITGKNAQAAFGCIADYDGDTTDQAVGNHFLFNEISHLSVSLASIYFDVNTLNNVVIGQCGATGIDLGVGNVFQCSDRHH